MSSIATAARSLFRGFRRSPGFILITLVTLGVGIGANAAIFTVVNSVLIRPLPYPEPERLVGVWNTAPGYDMERLEHSDGTYLLYRKENRVLEDLGIYWDGSVTLTGGQEPERILASGTTGSLFNVLRVPPALGRSLREDDERPGAEPVAVLSHALWQRRFGGDPQVIGSTLRIDSVTRRVVGVMPEHFHFPHPDTEIWLPMTLDPANLQAGDFNYPGVGRLKPGITPEQAAREMSPLVWRLTEISGLDIPREMIESARLAVLVQPLRDDVVGSIAQVLWILLGSVGLILLIACANVANLFLVRAEERQREVAVRSALGASRTSILGLFLSESVVLGLLGGVLGIALAVAGVRLLVRLQPPGIPRLEEIGVDGTVLAFTVLLSILSGLLFGGIAAMRHGTPNLVPALKDGGRGGTAGRGRHRARNVLVAAQVALALVLLVGAGLMVRSFVHMMSVDPGIDPQGVLTARLDLPESVYPDVHATARFAQQALERVRAVPGVQSAGVVSLLPLSGNSSTSAHSIEDHPLPPGGLPPILGTRFVSPGYFEAMGIPVIEGEVFDRIDPAKRGDGVVISAAVAQHFWPGRSALGKRLAPGLHEGDSPWFTVVGVVGSVREKGLGEEPAEAVYYPLVRQAVHDEGEAEWVPRGLALVVRTRQAPEALARPLREAVWTLDPNLPLSQVRTMEEVIERSAARTSFTMLLLVIAAAMALLLGAVGIYGVISYVVSQRTQEIGVRMALGAKRRDIVRMVLGEGLLVTAAGLVLGLAGAWGMTRLMVALLFGVQPTDPATFTAVPLVLAAVALVASWLPARRAADVEPLEAIRYE